MSGGGAAAASLAAVDEVTALLDLIRTLPEAFLVDWLAVVLVSLLLRTSIPRSWRERGVSAARVEGASAMRQSMRRRDGMKSILNLFGGLDLSLQL